MFSDNAKEDIKKLKEFSKKWNAIGFVPKTRYTNQ